MRVVGFGYFYNFSRFRAFGGHFVRYLYYEHSKVALHFLLQIGLTSSHRVCDTLHIARLRTDKDWGRDNDLQD